MVDPEQNRKPLTCPSDRQSVWLCGSTAVGKSEVALLLAERIGGEIISVDSMQVYRGMDIGTAKPSLAERDRVRHHLIDVIEVDQRFDAAQYRGLAWAAEEDIRARGGVPIFCGGTGLYFKVLFDGLGNAPAGSPSLRAELERTPLVQLLKELASCDAETYAQIDRNNPRRVARAVEVFRLTGKPFSRQKAEWGAAPSRAEGEHVLVGFRRQAEDLRRRIDARVEQMFRLGLVKETQELMRCGLAQNPTASQALGYRQVMEHLNGVRSLDETVELVKTRTRQFAKRQRTWFSHQLRVEWIDLAEGQEPRDIVERLTARWPK